MSVLAMLASLVGITHNAHSTTEFGDIHDDDVAQAGEASKVELENVIDVDGVTLDFAFISTVGTTSLPDTIEEAKKDERLWPMVKKALEDEMIGKYIGNEAWKIVKREPWMNVLKSKFVIKWTINPDGSIAKVKARLVACGYSQTSKEYTEIFAKTLSAFCSAYADIC